MTPKEKAEALVNAMGISVSYGINYTGGDDIPMYKNQYAKECALVAVDEMIKELRANAAQSTSWEFLEEVKQEIEKL